MDLSQSEKYFQKYCDELMRQTILARAHLKLWERLESYKSSYLDELNQAPHFFNFTIKAHLDDALMTLSSSLGVALEEKRLELEGGCSVEVDGYSDKPPMLCEAWVHYGEPKPSQSNKIMKDAFKLVFTEKCEGKTYKKILLFCDEDARKPFIGGSWQAQCLRDYGIKTEVYRLPNGLEKRVKAAYREQSRANR